MMWGSVKLVDCPPLQSLPATPFASPSASEIAMGLSAGTNMDGRDPPKSVLVKKLHQCSFSAVPEGFVVSLHIIIIHQHPSGICLSGAELLSFLTGIYYGPLKYTQAVILLTCTLFPFLKISSL